MQTIEERERARREYHARRREEIRLEAEHREGEWLLLKWSALAATVTCVAEILKWNYLL